jgi:hypothetical protein
MDAFRHVTPAILELASASICRELAVNGAADAESDLLHAGTWSWGEMVERQLISATGVGAEKMVE